MVRKTNVELRKEVRGGKGEIEFQHIISEEEFNGHGRLFAVLRMKPGSSIGFHHHIGNTEPYYILEGHGIFTDNDGSKTEVGPGDVCVIEFGQGHAIENASDTEDLALVAMIYNE